MEPSKRWLKVSSRIEVPEDLQFQKDYTITLVGSVVKKEIGDENDGTVEVTFKFKPVSMEIE